MDPANLWRYLVLLDDELPLYYVRRKIWTANGQRLMRVALTTDDYFVAHFGKLIVIVKSGKQRRDKGYEAALLPLPSELAKWADRNGLDPHKVESDGTVFYPYLLDGTDFRWAANWFLAIGGLMALLAACNITNAFRRQRCMEVSPVFRQLRRFGEPGTVVWSIERESKKNRFCLGDTWLMQSWLIQERFFGCTILRLDDVVSVREEVTRDPESVDSYSVRVTDKEGPTICIRRNSDYLMKALVAFLRERLSSANT